MDAIASDGKARLTRRLFGHWFGPNSAEGVCLDGDLGSYTGYDGTSRWEEEKMSLNIMCWVSPILLT